MTVLRPPVRRLQPTEWLQQRRVHASDRFVYTVCVYTIVRPLSLLLSESAPLRSAESTVCIRSTGGFPLLLFVVYTV